MAGILRGRDISAAFFLQTGPQAVLQGYGRNTNAHSRDCLQAFGIPMNDNKTSCPKRTARTQISFLLALLRDDTNGGVDGIVRVRREGVAPMAQHYACSFKSAMILLLRRHNIWPERFYRNAGTLNSREMARLLESRVFIAGCGALGGHVAVLLVRLGIGSLRLCDPDVFEESNLNRQYFCTEQTLGSSKVLACRDDLLGMASHMEIDAHEVAANPENLPELFHDLSAREHAWQATADKFSAPASGLRRAGHRALRVGELCPIMVDAAREQGPVVAPACCCAMGVGIHEEHLSGLFCAPTQKQGAKLREVKHGPLL